jgi:2-aminoadipate transaminase
VDSGSDIPLYKQLAEGITVLIDTAVLRAGEKLPATRELAGQLGLNRTTVSAAYALLEEAKRIEGQVGRGSFVAGDPRAERAGRDWEGLLPPMDTGWKLGWNPAGHKIEHRIDISFASSRPAQDEFPLNEFRRLSKQVIDSDEAGEILQLGSSHGYAPLRRYLLEDAVNAGVARAGDDLLITNGCQQGLDLLARLFASPGSSVAIEDPVYHGLLRVFSRSGTEIIPVPVDALGLDPNALEQVLQRQRPKLLVVTPSFQNPTGASLPLDRRKRIVALANRFGCVLVENDIYSELRYTGSPLPTLKELDETGNTILLRSYSKVSFPGLRVGWVIAPRPVIARLAEAKEISDLHSDQLSQAVLLRFAESGELEKHLQRTRRAGAERLNALLKACAQHLPARAKFTRPEGGMNLWIELPQPLTAELLLRRVQEKGVTFLPGRHFSPRNGHARGLRISFGGLTADQITCGIRILGQAAESELTAAAKNNDFEPAAALV